jgi:hypothetical protein
MASSSSSATLYKETRWRLSPSNIVGVVAIANFVSFVVVASLLGGDALNGHMADGHYYLRSHGTDLEVGAGVWTYSRWHAISLFVTHPVAMVVGLRQHYLKKRDG